MKLQDIPLYCRYCGEELIVKGILDFSKYYYDVIETGKKKLFCNEEHYNLYWNQFLVEEYNGSKIYQVKDGLYIPYLGCHYAFELIEDCRARIDNKNISVVDSRWLGL
jgi:hypothetical protein